MDLLKKWDALKIDEYQKNALLKMYSYLHSLVNGNTKIFF